MKKLLAGVLVGFVLGVAFLGSVLYVSAVSPPTATKNGDTNGDGNIDISDAVHLLSFLFTGGAEIAQIDCPSTAPTNFFVATGQTQCLGEAGVVDCSIPKARGQDAAFKLGCPFEGRFTDNTDGTITDHCTGLMWTKGYVDVDGDGEIVGEKDSLRWAEACQFADDMTYLGRSDWRVPNVHELLSIMNFGEVIAPLHIRPYMSVFNFSGSWSSTHNSGSGIAVGALPCDCSSIAPLGIHDRLSFAAVRGPAATP